MGLMEEMGNKLEEISDSIHALINGHLFCNIPRLASTAIPAKVGLQNPINKRMAHFPMSTDPA